MQDDVKVVLKKYKVKTAIKTQREYEMIVNSLKTNTLYLKTDDEKVTMY